MARLTAISGLFLVAVTLVVLATPSAEARFGRQLLSKWAPQTHALAPGAGSQETACM
jgi:hypothetical protein